MKTKLLIFSVLFGALFMLQSCYKEEDIVFPQEKLQFNKVVYIELDTLLPSCSDCSVSFTFSETIIVGTNKALKVESINFSNVEDPAGAVYLNNLEMSRDVSTNQFPIWVPTGDYNFEVRYSGSFGSHPSRQVTATLSGLEYDIVQ